MEGITYALSAFVILSALLLVPGASAWGPDQGGTEVFLRPSFLNAVEYGMVTGEIHFRSYGGNAFSVNVSGVPEEWIDYPESVVIDGREKVTYMVNPRESGTYHLLFRIEGAGKTFLLEQKLWVAKGHKQDEAPSDGESSPITGMFLSETDIPFLVSAGIIIAMLAAFVIGHSLLREEEPPSHLWGESKVY